VAKPDANYLNILLVEITSVIYILAKKVKTNHVIISEFMIAKCLVVLPWIQEMS